jgi:hypothetical protein
MAECHADNRSVRFNNQDSISTMALPQGLDLGNPDLRLRAPISH